MKEPRPLHGSRPERRIRGVHLRSYRSCWEIGRVIVSSAERAARERAISTDRLTTYRRAAAAAGCDVLDLYLWDREAAAAVLADIAILEVALRNAMHNVLTAHYLREDWYASDVPLDDRSRRALVQAWERLGKDQRTPGRVVARLMFGFWSGLLDAGGHNGLFKCDYEQLFRDVLRLAFPGGPPEARADAGAVLPGVGARDRDRRARATEPRCPSRTARRRVPVARSA